MKHIMTHSIDASFDDVKGRRFKNRGDRVFSFSDDMEEMETNATEKSGTQVTSDDRNSSSASDDSRQSFVMVGDENEVAQYLDDLRYLCTEEVRQLTREIDLQKRVMKSGCYVVAALVVTLLLSLAGSLMSPWMPALNQLEVVLVTLLLGGLVMGAVVRRTCLHSHATELIQVSRQRQARQVTSDSCLKSFLNEAGFLEDLDSSHSHSQQWGPRDGSPSPQPSPSSSHSSPRTPSLSPKVAISSSEENVPDADAMTVGAQEVKVNTNENASHATSVLVKSENSSGDDVESKKAVPDDSPRIVDESTENFAKGTNGDVSINNTSCNDGGMHDDKPKDGCMNFGMGNSAESVNGTCDRRIELEAGITHDESRTGHNKSENPATIDTNDTSNDTGINDEESRTLHGVGPSNYAGTSNYVVTAGGDSGTAEESYNNGTRDAQAADLHEEKPSNDVGPTNNGSDVDAETSGNVTSPMSPVCCSENAASSSDGASCNGDSAGFGNARIGVIAPSNENACKTNGTASTVTHERSEISDTASARVCREARSKASGINADPMNAEAKNADFTNPTSVDEDTGTSVAKSRVRKSSANSCSTDIGNSATDVSGQSLEGTAKNNVAAIDEAKPVTVCHKPACNEANGADCPNPAMTVTDAEIFAMVSDAGETSVDELALAVNNAEKTAAKTDANNTITGDENTSPTADTADNKTLKLSPRNDAAVNISNASRTTVEDITNTMTTARAENGGNDCSKPASGGTDPKASAAKPSQSGNASSSSFSKPKTAAYGGNGGSRVNDGAKYADTAANSKKSNRRFRRGRGAPPSSNRGAPMGGPRH